MPKTVRLLLDYLDGVRKRFANVEEDNIAEVQRVIHALWATGYVVVRDRESFPHFLKEPNEDFSPEAPGTETDLCPEDYLDD